MAVPTQYVYSIENDFPNQKVNTTDLATEITATAITISLSHINTEGDACNIWFNDALSVYDTTSTLATVILNHTGHPTKEPAPPSMPDGRPIVRADSRPFDFQTYYTMVGDDSTAGIGFGKEIMWDFSNDDDLVTGDHVPAGMKCKELLISFLCPTHTKDGAIYFFDAPWGSYIHMDVVIPPQQYFPNPYGPIPAAALGLDGTDMYSYSGNDYIPYMAYVLKYRVCGSCPMGDELNAEGSATSALPPGWCIRARIYTPSDEVSFKGFAELEIHRCHTVLMPGQTLEDLVNEH